MGEDYFGLGFVLSVQDNASPAFQGVSESLNNLMSSAEETFTNMSVGGIALNQLGNSAEGVGKKILGSFEDVGKSVINTGKTFETMRQTMSTLYGSAEVGAQKVQWAMNLAAKTPFQMEDLTSMMTRMKAIGVEADQQYSDGKGHLQSLAQYIGDLAALHPEKGLGMTTQFIQELLELSPRGTVAMRSLGISAEALQKAGAGDKWGATTEERIQQLVKVSGYMANGLSDKLMTTWSGLASNIEDQFTRVKLAIADSGMFDTVKATLINISNAIGNLDSDKLTRLGSSLSDAFAMIWKPVDMVVTGIINFVNWMETLAETNPTLAKIVLGFTALTGVLLVGTGMFLKFSGGILMALGGLSMVLVTITKLGGIGAIFDAIGGAVTGLVTAILPAVAVIGILFLAWKDNFIGIRDMSITFVHNTQEAFQKATDIAHMGSQDMADAVDKLDTHTFFGGLTLAIVKLEVLWMSLVDAWGDEKLSTENFDKASKLGLLPLISTILDVKRAVESFWAGFKEGLEGFMTVASKVAQVAYTVFSAMVSAMGPVANAILTIVTGVARISIKPMEALGQVIGFIAGVLVASKIASVVDGIISSVTRLFSIFSKVFSGVGDLFSPLVKGLSTVWDAIDLAVTSGLSEVLDLLGSMLGGGIADILTTIATGVLDFVEVATGPIGIIIAIATSIAVVVAKWTEIKTAIGGFAEYAQTKLQEFATYASGAFSPVVYAIKGVIALAQSIGGFFAKIGSDIFSSLSVIGTILMSVFTPMKTTMSNLWGSITSGFGTIRTAVETIINNVVAKFNTFTTALTPTFTRVSSAISNIVSVIARVLGAIITVATPIVSGLVRLIMTGLEMVVAVFKTIFGIIFNTVVNLFGGTIKYILNIIGTLIAGVGGILSGLASIFMGYFQIIYGVVANVIAMICDLFTGQWANAWTDFTNIFTTAWEGFKTIFSGVGEVITSAVTTIINTFLDVAGAIEDAILSPFKGAMSYISSFGDNVSSIIGGIKNLGGDVGSGLSSAVASAKHMLGFATGAEIYGEGAAVLHPGEVVVNGDLTNKLRSFLNTNLSNGQPQVATSVGSVSSSSASAMPVVAKSNVASNIANGNTTATHDNSVNIHEGAIQITMSNGGNDVDIKSLAKKIGTEIQKQQQLNRVRNYKQ